MLFCGDPGVEGLVRFVMGNGIAIPIDFAIPRRIARLSKRGHGEEVKMPRCTLLPCLDSFTIIKKQSKSVGNLPTRFLLHHVHPQLITLPIPQSPPSKHQKI